VVGGLTRAYERVYDGQHTVVFWIAGCFSNIDRVLGPAPSVGPLKRLYTGALGEGAWVELLEGVVYA